MANVMVLGAAGSFSGIGEWDSALTEGITQLRKAELAITGARPPLSPPFTSPHGPVCPPAFLS